MITDKTNLKKRSFINVENEILHNQVCEISLLMFSLAIMLSTIGFIMVSDFMVLIGYIIMGLGAGIIVAKRIYCYLKLIPDYDYKFVETEENIIIFDEKSQISAKFSRNEMRVEQDENNSNLIYISDKKSKLNMFAKDDLRMYLKSLVN